MEKLIKPGRIIFAFAMMALGALSLSSDDFIVGRPPAWPEGFRLKSGLAYLSGALFIAASVGLLIRVKGFAASLLMTLLILSLSISRHVVYWLRDWPNMYKSFALVGGSLIMAASFLTSDLPYRKDPRIRLFTTVGSFLIASFFISAGYAHFKYADFVKGLIPDFIPFPVFWTYFCGICLFAGGIGLILPKTRKWAALLSAVMIAGWFLLLHVPRFITAPDNPSDRMGLCESFGFVGMLAVLAGLIALQEKQRI